MTSQLEHWCKMVRRCDNSIFLNFSKYWGKRVGENRQLTISHNIKENISEIYVFQLSDLMKYTCNCDNLRSGSEVSGSGCVKVFSDPGFITAGQGSTRGYIG